MSSKFDKGGILVSLIALYVANYISIHKRQALF
jgi:hypothetical protein